MTFSEQFKEVFELICDKMGVAIDWTQENVVPYVMELCKRFVIFNIVEEALWLVGSIIVVVAIGFLSKKIFEDYKKCADTRKDTFWWEEFCGGISPKIGTIFALVIGGMLLLLGLIMIPCSILELLKWAIVPEVQIIKEITSFVSAM